MRTNSPKNLKRKKDTVWNVEDVLLDGVALDKPFDPSAFFPKSPDAPVEIEIGAGKGTFIVARAKYQPQINFIGIEYAKPYAVYAADRARRNHLANVKMIAGDAEPFFTSALPDQSVFRVHLYYPDPWPKRKHRRRRLLQPEFLKNVYRVLQTGGQLLIVTDHRDYFEHILTVITDAAGFARCDFPKLLDSDVHIVGTNFENKYVEQGRNLYKAAMIKYKKGNRQQAIGNSIKTNSLIHKFTLREFTNQRVNEYSN